MEEIFKDIIGYEGLYQVSNLGHVKALPRYNTDKNGKTKFYPGKLLSYDLDVRNATTYKRVTLSKQGKTRRFQVHRLVCTAFTNNPENKPYVNHIDNNGSNNEVANLEWCTHSENMKHSQKQGRQFDNQSKAGKTAGANKAKEIHTSITNDIGNTYGALTILSDATIGKKYKVLCECQRCHLTTTIDYTRMKRVNLSNCNRCARVKDENLQSWKDNLKI